MPKVAIAFATALMIGGAGMTQAGNNDHVSYECADAAMCDALQDAVKVTAPLPQPLTLKLVVENRTDQNFSAHLAWTGAAEGRGETMTLSVVDTTLRASMLDRFMRELVKNTQLPQQKDP